MGQLTLLCSHNLHVTKHGGWRSVLVIAIAVALSEYNYMYWWSGRYEDTVYQ